MENDQRLAGYPHFVALGNMYEVENLIWSGVAREGAEFLERARREGGGIRYMNWANAKAFCKRLGKGARLPTQEEYDALGRAMGYPNNYNPDMMADVRQNYFWSSSPIGDRNAWRFNGIYGHVDSAYRGLNGAVRCVVAQAEVRR
jgi:hypothetical protein